MREAAADIEFSSEAARPGAGRSQATLRATEMGRGRKKTDPREAEATVQKPPPRLMPAQRNTARPLKFGRRPQH